MAVIRYFFVCILFHCVVLLQVPNVNGSPEILETTLPFCINLPRTLGPGQVMKIKGFAGTGRTRLHLNLSPDCTKSKRIFHLCLVFADRFMSRNVYYDGGWKEEETGGPFPFAQGRKFELQIIVQEDGYEGIGDNVTLWTYAHRLPYTEASILEANGENVIINEIEFIDEPAQEVSERYEKIYPVTLQEPIRKPTVPFWARFPADLQAGDVINITGRPTFSEGRFNINLCDDCLSGHIMLHLDIRFKFLMDTETVLQNAYIYHWTSEERSKRFPFHAGQPFYLTLEVGRRNYMISVGGVNYWNFTQRISFPPAKQLLVADSVELIRVDFIEGGRSKMILTAMPTPARAKIIPRGSSICMTASYLIVSLAFLSHF